MNNFHLATVEGVCCSSYSVYLLNSPPLSHLRQGTNGTMNFILGEDGMINNNESYCNTTSLKAFLSIMNVESNPPFQIRFNFTGVSLSVRAVRVCLSEKCLSEQCECVCQAV